MYAAYGVASPFMPALFRERGLSPEELGQVLAAGTAVRLLAAPLAARVADLLQRLKLVLFLCTAAGALVSAAYLAGHSFWALLALSLLHGAALAPMTVLADALALGAARQRHGFEYGWVRGSGSAAFIAGTLLSGQLVGAGGLSLILWLQAGLLGAAALAALQVPELAHERTAGAARSPAGGVALLLRMPRYRSLVLAAALILGSHAVHDAFAVIRWREAGIGPALSAALWSEAVAAEVLVFFLAGPALLRRVAPWVAIAIAAGAGVARWVVMANTADPLAMALVQPLHGVTFALLHLACMRLIAGIAPGGLEGTAQALYATVGVGAATALLTLASGWLFGRFGPDAFFFMAALCAMALWPAARLRGA